MDFEALQRMPGQDTPRLRRLQRETFQRQFEHHVSTVLAAADGDDDGALSEAEYAAYATATMARNQPMHSKEEL